MPVFISGSVGENGRNRPEDVQTVYALFNKILPAPLAAGDVCSAALIQAVKEFQKPFLPHPDGRIDVGGTTWRKLLAAAGLPEEGKKLLLSFDVGPAPQDALHSILDTLEAGGIEAEFYVLGKETESLPAAAKEIVRRGHSIQNHSYSHPDLARASRETVWLELHKTQESIRKATGVTPTKIRPPYGAGGWPSGYDPELAEVAASLSLKIQNWDIDTLDWKAPKGIGPAKLAKIRQQLAGQGRKSTLNVLMHVQHETARDLGGFIAQLRAWGYAFAKP
jgi:peptidoglycan/xylan/chitin deacetylase (PgdA/CDA1 family)